MADIPSRPSPDEVQLPPVYRSLEEIRLRKSQLRTQLQKDTTRMDGMAHTLFKEEEGANSSSQRFLGIVSKGATFVDGMILAYKLYRRFQGDKLPAKRRKSGLLGLFGGKKKKKK